MSGLGLRASLMCVLGALVTSAACADIPPYPDRKPVEDDGHSGLPAWICGREYVNHAWGFHQNGKVIDSQGRILSYDTSSRGPVQHESETYTAEELASRYDGATPDNRSVPIAEIEHFMPLIAEAAREKMSEPKSVGADMGSRTLYCFVQDMESGAYREVPLVIMGDWTSVREGDSAKQLADWLEQTGL